MAPDGSVTSLPAATSLPSLPPIAALFLVVFDHRKGYVLQWRESLPGVEIEGVVEYKSLPSGLHNIEEDLVYFTHDDYAGVSAYLNKPDVASERNASMLAVGCLVKMDGGRMGRSWLHAGGLRELAEKQVKDIQNYPGLEEYWQEHKLDEDRRPKMPDESTDTLSHDGQANGYQKSRSMSTGSAFAEGAHTLAPHHPATTLMEMLSVFGPLIFPLYRAALLRKRILLVTEAPVEFACNVVYNLSVLSSLSRDVMAYVPSHSSSRRIRALFNVGVQDIDMLSQPAEDGWVACTTDDVLATKSDLFDLAVFMPSGESKKARKKVYPKIVPSSKELAKQFPKVGVRASQRDAARYEGLIEGLRRYESSRVEREGKHGEEQQQRPEEEVEEDAPSVCSSRAPSIHEHRDIVEPASWSQVAYTSLLWWATSGDRHRGLGEEQDEEAERDAMLLGAGGEEDGRTKEVVTVSYFRRLTGMLFQAVYDVLRQEQGMEEAIEEEGRGEVDERPSQRGGEEHEVGHHYQPSFDEGSAQRPLLKRKRSETPGESNEELAFTAEDVSAMGLDVWSRGDRDFVQEVVKVWWGREARVRGGGVECCGVRIL